MESQHNLVIEIFYGGSHKQLLDTIIDGLEMKESCCLVTLPDKKWHWKARTGALTILDAIPLQHNFKVLFTTSVLNLAELIALRPDLQSLRKVVYFHENQLIYPVKQQKERDFQYGYNQILTSLVADEVLFNSEFNKNSFLSTIQKFMRLQPGPSRPKGLREKIEPKCRVLYFPIDVDRLHIDGPCMRDSQRPLHILWPHRWEHDKDPDMFARVLLALKRDSLQFRVSMLGKVCSEIPESLVAAKDELGDSILHWGYVETREEYISILHTADVVVSTAKHEFFGVAMIEAVICGSYPLCPDAIVYPEIYPSQCLYKTEEELVTRLRDLCQKSAKVSNFLSQTDVQDFEKKYSAVNLLPEYKKIFYFEDHEKFS